MNKIFAVVVGLALAFAAQAAPEGEVLGVALDREDGLPIIFASERPWDNCKGGAAYKADVEKRTVAVGCWVVIADEGVFFIMWKDGNLSNVLQSEVRLCDDKESCKREVME